MDNIKHAIRNALAKIDARNASSRQRIYESVWSAHERALAANAALSTEHKEQRRQDLKDAIVEIEKEFVANAGPQSHTSPPVALAESEDPVLDISAADEGPALDRDDVRPVTTGWRTAGRVRADAASGQSEKRVHQKKKAGNKRHSPLYRYGLPVLALILALVIGTSLYNSFADLSRQSSPSALNSEENMPLRKEGQEPGDEAWITIFKASDAAHMSVRGRATAQIMQDGTHSFARVTSFSENDIVTFDVGQGVLDRLVGKKATFDIVAKADGEKATQMSVSCNFANLGDCGRRRYDVNQTMNDFLFDMSFPAGQKAGGAGVITINSDLNGTGISADIYEIRVSLHDAQ